MEDQSMADRAEADERQIETNYKQKLYQLEITTRNYDIMKNMKQQKYLQSLKSL